MLLGEEKCDPPHQPLIDEVRSEENFERAFGIFEEVPHSSFFFCLYVTFRFRGVGEGIRITVGLGGIRDWGVCRHFLLQIVVVII